ncbi:hypothetical protein ACOME3_003556 [Neoechinorhynchus agilis]
MMLHSISEELVYSIIHSIEKGNWDTFDHSFKDIIGNIQSIWKSPLKKLILELLVTMSFDENLRSHLWTNELLEHIFAQHHVATYSIIYNLSLCSNAVYNSTFNSCLIRDAFADNRLTASLLNVVIREKTMRSELRKNTEFVNGVFKSIGKGNGVSCRLLIELTKENLDDIDLCPLIEIMLSSKKYRFQISETVCLILERPSASLAHTLVYKVKDIICEDCLLPDDILMCLYSILSTFTKDESIRSRLCGDNRLVNAVFYSLLDSKNKQLVCQSVFLIYSLQVYKIKHKSMSSFLINETLEPGLTVSAQAIIEDIVDYVARVDSDFKQRLIFQKFKKSNREWLSVIGE